VGKDSATAKSIKFSMQVDGRIVIKYIKEIFLALFPPAALQQHLQVQRKVDYFDRIKNKTSN
jgi:subtilisin-like proprotein convertase family protein